MVFNLLNLFSGKRNYTIIIVCFCISLFIWFVQKLSTEHTFQTEIPLEFDVPESRTFTEDPNQVLKITLRGKGWELIRTSRVFSFENPQVVLSEELEQTIEINQIREAIRSLLPDMRLQIIEVEPTTISVKLAQTYQKTVPLELVSNITFYPDHDISNPIMLDPDSINIFGPQTLLDSISTWQTEEFQVENIKENLVRTIKLKSPEQPVIKLSTQSTIVSVEVQEYTEKIFDLPIHVNSKSMDNSKLRAVPERARIYAVLPLDMYDLVNEDEFKLIATVDSPAVLTKNRKVKLELQLYPGYIKSFKIYPSNIEVFQID